MRLGLEVGYRAIRRSQGGFPGENFTFRDPEKLRVTK